MPLAIRFQAPGAPGAFFWKPRVAVFFGHWLVQLHCGTDLHSSHSWAMLLAPAGHLDAPSRRHCSANFPHPGTGVPGIWLVPARRCIRLHSSHSRVMLEECRRGVSRDGKGRLLAALYNTREFGRRLRASYKEWSPLTRLLQLACSRPCRPSGSANIKRERRMRGHPSQASPSREPSRMGGAGGGVACEARSPLTRLLHHFQRWQERQ